MSNINTYREFFEIDSKYFPCIDDSAIQAGAPWENTYPHETFISLLKNVERMLGGTTKRSVWIHGAYGTGKSQCAYALKRILEVPESELQAYWNMYEPLKENTDLMQKILGHKERKIVTVYRYASGSITTPRDLFFAIQESVKEALIKDERVTYYGENTLRESVIEWLEDSSHKEIFNILLNKEEWAAVFPQANADEVLNTLKKGTNVKEVMDNIARLSDKERISAMSLDADKLKSWLKDVITRNEIKILFIWDEFSGFFKQNKNSLDEFQKIVALCQEVPFYLVIVTHQTESIINNEDQSWSVVRQRFDFSQITLPDNIAFDLIGHAFNPIQDAKDMWDICADDLNSRLDDSRREVMKAARIINPKVIKDIMPIHPVAALVLKNIASAFQSNQRSMFDFIKTSNTDDVKAFQWFIDNTGPLDDHPLLTVDMLWNFFYEKGRDNLTSDIRMILDTYPQQQNLREDEKRVLKAILIMQAIDKRLGGAIELLKPTEQNIHYAFEGIESGLANKCVNLAKGLKDKGILVQNPIGNNKFAYGAAVLAGDQNKIDEYKRQIRKASTTAKLVADGKLSSALNLPTPLKLRFCDDINSGALIAVTQADFTRTINGLKEKSSPWKHYAVMAFAKDESEAIALRSLIKESSQKKEYENIVFIDALSTPLGDDFDSYVEYAAMSQYYQRNNNKSASENQNKAMQVLSVTWKNKIYNGNFVLHYSGCEEGEKVRGGNMVADVLKAIVMSKHKYIFDFSKGVTENQIKLTQGKAAAKCAIIKKTSGVVSNAEKSVLQSVWDVDDYWNNSSTRSENISVIKKSIDSLISDSFDRDGQVSIGEIYNHLENDYGFAPSNLSAFITGFLLKEYSGEPYRYADSNGGHEPMSPDKLSEMIGNYIGKKPSPTYIVKMTAEEKAFYELTESVWGISANTCVSASQAGQLVKNKMQSMGLPIWSLQWVDNGAFEIVEKYINLVQKEGNEAHAIAISIGETHIKHENTCDLLKELVTIEKCKEGMNQFLEKFEEGKLISLANEIGASENVLKDVSGLFSVKYSSLWNENTGKDQIKTLVSDYSFVKVTNSILNENATSKSEALIKWRNKLKFARCSYEALKDKYIEIRDIFDFLHKIYCNEEILPDYLEKSVAFLANYENLLKDYFDKEDAVFKEIYGVYLDELTDEEISQLRTPEMTGIFAKSRTDSNAMVKRVAEEFRKKQLKTQLNEMWASNTNSKNPRDWSLKNRTPILALVSENEYNSAKKAFETINKINATDKEISEAISYLESTELLKSINDKSVIDNAFISILGSYKTILTDIEKVRNALERTQVDTYEWDSNPIAKSKIEKLAMAEYNAGGSDKAISIIESMSNEKLKEYLIEMARSNMKLGLEILNGGE